MKQDNAYTSSINPAQAGIHFANNAPAARVVDSFVSGVLMALLATCATHLLCASAQAEKCEELPGDGEAEVQMECGDVLSNTEWHRVSCPSGGSPTYEGWSFGATGEFNYSRSISEFDFYSERGTYTVDTSVFPNAVFISVDSGCYGDDAIEFPEAEDEPCCDPECVCDICWGPTGYSGVFAIEGDNLLLGLYTDSLLGAMRLSPEYKECSDLANSLAGTVWVDLSCPDNVESSQTTWSFGPAGEFQRTYSTLLESNQDSGTYTIDPYSTTWHIEIQISRHCISSEYQYPEGECGTEAGCGGWDQCWDVSETEIGIFEFERTNLLMALGDTVFELGSEIRLRPEYAVCPFDNGYLSEDSALTGDWERRPCESTDVVSETWYFNGDQTFARMREPANAPAGSAIQIASGEYRVDTSTLPRRLDLMVESDCRYSSQKDRGKLENDGCAEPYFETWWYEVGESGLAMVQSGPCRDSGAAFNIYGREGLGCTLVEEPALSAARLLRWLPEIAVQDSGVLSREAATYFGVNCAFDRFDLDGNGLLAPAELVFAAGEESPVHSADTNADGLVSLNELLRIVQMYNSRGYRCSGSPLTEDGYQPIPVAGGGLDTACPAHTADYSPADGLISLSELLRAVQLYNAGGYAFCASGGEDGFCLTQQ